MLLSRLLLALSIVFIVGASSARAQSGPEATFKTMAADEGVAEELATRCGPVEVVADFSTFQATEWIDPWCQPGAYSTGDKPCRWEYEIEQETAAGKADPAEVARRKRADEEDAVKGASSACLEAMRGVASACTSDFKVAVSRELKTLRCVFAGAGKDDGNPDLFVRRNVSWDKGVLSIRAQRTMANIADNTSAVLIKALGGGAHGGVVGEKCQSFADCESSLCHKGICAACGGKAACRSGTRCHMTVCRTAAEIAEMANTLASPTGIKDTKPAALKRLGQMCKANSDCSSGKCEQRTAQLKTCQ